MGYRRTLVDDCHYLDSELLLKRSYRSNMPSCGNMYCISKIPPGFFGQTRMSPIIFERLSRILSTKVTLGVRSSGLIRRDYASTLFKQWHKFAGFHVLKFPSVGNLCLARLFHFQGIAGMLLNCWDFLLDDIGQNVIAVDVLLVQDNHVCVPK